MRQVYVAAWQRVWEFGGLTGYQYVEEMAGQCEMRGSLRCAVHDETVNSFGRDDEYLGRG